MAFKNNILCFGVNQMADSDGLKAGIENIKKLRVEFWENLLVPGSDLELNQNLEKAGRVADFLELGELFAKDALSREESCGGHFREEFQDSEGETLRDDDKFKYVAAWQYQDGNAKTATLHQEALNYEFIKIAARNYK